MNTTEELDDFELSIRSKLADFEVTPPESSWNAIVQNAGTESRKMKVVWLNKGSFLIVFFASMFSMWLAFGSINFELNNYSEDILILINEINQSRKLAYLEHEFSDKAIELSSSRNESIKEKKLNEVINNNNILERTIIKNEVEDSNNVEIVELDFIQNIQLTSVENPNSTLSNIFTPFNEFSENPTNSFGIKHKFGFYGAIESGLLYTDKLLSNVSNTNLSKGSVLQFQNSVKFNLTYSLSRNIDLSTGLKYHRINQHNNFIETESITSTGIDSVVIGYIQDPVNGRTPVYEYNSFSRTELLNHPKNFNNILHGLEIPVGLNWRFYSRNRFSLAMSLNASYISLQSYNYKFLNKEGSIITLDNKSVNVYTTSTSFIADYRFGSSCSVYFMPTYFRSNLNTINNGAGISFGIKYKFL